MKAIVASVLAVLFLTGCVTKVWYQPGQPPAQAHRDLARARVEAAKVNNPLAMMSGWFWMANEGNKEELINNFMMAEGWTLVPAKTLTNASQYPRP